jgi:hypothetical protein
MTEATKIHEQFETAFLLGEVSDEALEAAADMTIAGAANYTLAACTGLTACPS